MPDDVVTSSSSPAGGKQFGGQPWWVWAAGGAALIGGYIYLRNKGKAAGAQPAAGTTSTVAAGSPTGLSWEQFLLFLHDQQSSPGGTPAPSPVPKPKPKPPARKPPYGQQLFWSGDLNRWLTGAQWHQWHVAHEQRLGQQHKAA